MIIRKKRVRSARANIRGVDEGDRICISLSDIDRFRDKLEEVGFSKELKVGEQILPAPLGNVSRFNAEGDYRVHRDQPMETAYRQAEWHWQEFHGRYDRVEQSKIVEIPYERYPRTFIEPPAVELTIAESSGEKALVAPPLPFMDEVEPRLVHVINLFLELFGECEILRGDLSPILPAKPIRLNWEVLPPGKLPWEKLKSELRPIVNRQSEGNRAVVNKRHETIASHDPQFVAVGRGGFDGYVIFGFPSKSVYILESTQINNATYVLDRNWEELSTMTKAELLNENLHKDRIIHRENWFDAIHELLGK